MTWRGLGGVRTVLELVDESLEAFLRAEVPLSATDIDVSFAPPDREWSARLVRPTVNLFLWDLRRSAGRARSGVRTVQREGTTAHQPAPPVIELRYVVTAWASDAGDERGLLSGLLSAFLKHSTVPHAYLAAAFDELQAPTLLVARAGEDHMDVFKALDGRIKPGINLVLATEFETGVTFPAGPPVTAIETAVGKLNGQPPDRNRRVAGEVVDAVERDAIGAVVRSPTDSAIVNAAGRFLLRAAAGDDVTLETTPPLVTTVPGVGGIRFEP